MGKVSIASYLVPDEQSGSGASSFSYFTGPDDPIHLRLHKLPSGAELVIEGGASDRALFVWQGAAQVGDHRLSPGSSAIIESGATLHLTAADEDSRILLFNANPGETNGGMRTTAGRVRVLPRAAVPRYGGGLGDGKLGGAMHADATPPDSSVWLHENYLPASTGEPPLVHSHSVDEIIVVTGGEMRFGNRLLGPGTALAIAADAFYSFTAGPTGLAFVNFRAGRPSDILLKNGDRIDEVAYWREMTGSPEPITLDR